MKNAPAALSALCLLSVPVLLAQAPSRPTPRPPAPQTQSGAGVTVQTGPEAPKGAAPAEVEDFRALPEGEADPFALERLGLGAAQAKDLAKARVFFEKAWKLGRLPAAAYNLACVDANEKKIDAAFLDLDRALGAGFDDEATLKSDPDLAPLRSSPRWAGLVERAARNRAAGDAAAVKEGIFVAPPGRPAAVLVLLHDAPSSPIAVSGPFVAAAQKRGLLIGAPRGPSKSADKKFGWGSAERATAAVDASVSEARKRAGDARLPVYIVGVGRGGTEALTIAARTAAGTVAGAGSIGGPFD
ncbi:MAG TPA: hypothetical protein PLB02_14005, partial [Thermoanaerobaculia bacterium]|nr:hypothetical protein [Thermoanaerobaculia bacterium]